MEAISITDAAQAYLESIVTAVKTVALGVEINGVSVLLVVVGIALTMIIWKLIFPYGR